MAGFLDGASQALSAIMLVSGKDNDGKEATEKVSNPAHAVWIVQEQQVLSYLPSSLSRNMLIQVTTLTRASKVWEAIEGIFASQSRAHVINTHMALSTTRKGNLSVAEYIGKMKALADEMASAGKHLDDDDLISYILTGLDLVVSSVAARVEPMTVGDLYAQLLSFEQRMELLQGGSRSSTNSMLCGGRGGGRHEHGHGNGGGDRGRGYCHDNDGKGNNTNKPICQLCGKVGHTAIKCWKRFDTSYAGEEKVARAAMSTYGIDTNWYLDTRATDHITGELEKLSVKDKYNGNDKVHTASGSGMDINYVGSAIVHSPVRDLHLKNSLHVPRAQKNLVFVIEQ